MIYIDITGKAPVQAWLTRADAVTQLLLAATTVPARNQIIDDNDTLWGEIKDHLLNISNQKCWYSESKENYSHWHVDHFRPKKRA